MESIYCHCTVQNTTGLGVLLLDVAHKTNDTQYNTSHTIAKYKPSTQNLV